MIAHNVQFGQKRAAPGVCLGDFYTVRNVLTRAALGLSRPWLPFALPSFALAARAQANTTFDEMNSVIQLAKSWLRSSDKVRGLFSNRDDFAIIEVRAGSDAPTRLR